jgi:putative membrane-bound dehydrogenase-like protein
VSRYPRISTATAAVLVGLAALSPATASRAEGPAAGPRLVFMIGEDEYRTWETLPAFVKRELDPLGFRTTVVMADPKDPNHFPGLEALRDADLLFLSVRRRTPPEAELALVREHLAAGKPLVGIRTASHAFALRKGDPPPGHAQWPGFDREVLGCRYDGHLAQKEGADVATTPRAEQHEILTGVRTTSFHTAGGLYRSHDLAPGTNVLLRGLAAENGQPVTFPVAWTYTHKKARVFYTSLGHPDDFRVPDFSRILVNAIHWALKRPIPGRADAGPAQAADPSFAARNRYKEDLAANEQVERIIRGFKGAGEIGDNSAPTPAEQAVARFRVREPFEMKLVAAEPVVRQPLDITWDRRGRLWVVQYLQYPFPAGLKVVKYDQYLRAVFDKVPAAPPHHVPGADKVTVLEDADGDGRFDKAKDVITGLNIASSVAIGRGGIWVLNPPYLLFYADADGDDVPDGDPEVHLSGFGLEDTHSVANSLEWGPDGWLYGANGSTTTGTVSSAVTKDVHFKGQMIWRYHPDTKIFEIFAEGGGNTFSLEIDAAGRVFSGTNNGETRGMHYVQGGYARKNWGKHGPLTNPFALGFYEHMRHQGEPERFSQTFAIYQGGAFPAEYDGTVITANALQNRVLASRLLRDGSTYRTVDLPPLVLTSDRWFRPVDLEVGPDGAAYMADWYDTRLTHVDPRDNWHKESGRIYRLQVKGASPIAPFDLAKLGDDALIDLLGHRNKWFRMQAVHLLGERRDAATIPRLRHLAADGSDPRALGALWALNLCGGFDDAAAMAALGHRDPDVRRWGVRLVGDARQASPAVAARLAELAASEPDVQVRSQLASSAKRLPGDAGLAIARALLARSEDADDPHLPLLIWWAIESKADTDRDAVLALFRDAATWRLPIVERSIAGRLMQRYAMADDPSGLDACARLLAMAPGPEATSRLMSGLMEAYRGRKMDGLPPALAGALERYQHGLGQSDLALGLRLGRPDAVARALKVVADERAEASARLSTIEILGQTRPPGASAALLGVLASSRSPAIRRGALEALMNFDDPAIAPAVLRQYAASLPDEQGVRGAAQRLLASRKAWATALLDAIDRSTIDPRTIPLDVVQQMQLHHDPEIDRRIAKHWGRIRATPAETQAQVARLRAVLGAGPGDASAGRSVFTQHCATCHTLFGEGGKVGPDLTGYERTNLEFLLPAVADPSGGIREEYTAFAVATTDGRTLSGLIEDQNTRTVTLRGVDNRTTLINRAEIEEMRALPTSLMPDGLTAKLSDAEVRDLFAYLMSRTPGTR